MRAAIVGCGNIAKVHASCIQHLKGHELVAFADCKVERAEEFSNQFGGRVFPSLEEMLVHENIDVLHICTPHYLHTPMAIYGLSHGVHIFMEKPPVISYEQYELLKEVSSEKYIGFCFQNRYNGSVIQVKEMLNSGIPGKILGARGLVTWNRTESYYTTSDWRGSLAMEGGGVLINQSIHTLDLMNYLINKSPISIDAMITNHHLKGKNEVEDTMSAYIKYPNAIACFYATSSYIEDAPPLIELQCENMKIRIEDQEVTYNYKCGKTTRILVESQKAFGKSYWGGGHSHCMQDFYDCIREKRRFSLDLEGIKDTIHLMLGAYESAKSGTEIQLI